MGLIEMIAVILIVLWILGFALNIGGGLIHILLILAIIIFLMRFFKKAA